MATGAEALLRNGKASWLACCRIGPPGGDNSSPKKARGNLRLLGCLGVVAFAVRSDTRSRLHQMSLATAVTARIAERPLVDRPLPAVPALGLRCNTPSIVGRRQRKDRQWLQIACPAPVITWRRSARPKTWLLPSGCRGHSITVCSWSRLVYHVQSSIFL